MNRLWMGLLTASARFFDKRYRKLRSGNARLSEMPHTRSAWESPLARPPSLPPPTGSLKELREQALRCRDCPLWKHATQTVFGQGPAPTTMMLVGEQPG